MTLEPISLIVEAMSKGGSPITMYLFGMSMLLTAFAAVLGGIAKIIAACNGNNNHQG